jgi:RNA polymerase sigma-70 factor (ECF subfamily)
MSPGFSAQLQQGLQALQAGGPAATNELLVIAQDRLVRLARRMFRDFPRLREWVSTHDVHQGAMLRLWRALQAVPPRTPREFFGLAALQIRRELLDLIDRYHQRNLLPGEVEQSDSSLDPEHLQRWRELHEAAAALPDEEREVFDLIWYQGRSSAEAAELLGLELRAVQRRFRAAKLLLHKALEGRIPPL